MTIDSSWNGDFIENDKVIIFTAKETPATVEPNDVATFGAVMYSDQLAEVESFKLSGYRILKAEKLLIFKVLVVLELVWVMTFIIWFVIHIREAAFNRRHELDKKIITQAMNTLIGFVDAKDEYTRGHSARVAEYAAEIGRRMKLSDDEVTKLYYISLMHDCGKIAVPDAVLKKPDKLNNEEFAQIKAHTTKGDKLLEDFTAIPGIREGAHFHHERYDGNGYPAQLKGEKIPLFARIICVADSYDAMSTDRCYRPHLDKEDILRELKQNAGKQFDPEIVPYMIELIEDGFADKVHTKKY